MNVTEYRIYHRLNEVGAFKLLTAVPSTTFEYTHEDLLLGQDDLSEYRITAFNNSSESTPTNTVWIGTAGFYKPVIKQKGKEHIFGIANAYPNPVEDETTIKYSLDRSGEITIKLFNVLGEEIRTLLTTSLQAGDHEIKLKTDNLQPGIYFAILQSGADNSVTKIVVTKHNVN